MKPSESFVGQPIRDLQTMLRVLAEDDARLPTVVPDGIYGPQTMNAVSAIQRQNGIPVTGVADQKTWDRIVTLYEPALIRIEKAEPIEIILDPGELLRYGDSSPYIYLMQSMLIQLSKDHPSIYPPDHTGIMDESTVDAISAFQKLSGLPITGEVDKISWKHLSRQFTLNAHHNTVLKRNSNS